MNAAAVLLSDGRVSATAISPRASDRQRAVTNRDADVPAWPTQFDADVLASAIAAVTEACGGIHQRVTLIVPASWCYWHLIDLPKSRWDARAAAYAFEDYMPVPLEDVACAFARLARDRALGVAAPTASLRALLVALMEHGVDVDRIVPDALAAWAAVVSETDEPVGLLMRDTHRAVVAAGPGSWPVVVHAGRCDDLALATATVEAAVGADARAWHTFDLGREADRARLMESAVDPALPNLCTESLRGRAGETLLKPLTRSLGLAAVLLMALSVRFHVQRARIADAVEDVTAEQRAVFESVFPDAPMPPGAALRLASERVRLEGLTGLRDNGAQELAPTDPLAPLTGLRDLVAALPDDVRVNLLEVSVEDKQLSLRGQTRDHRDAERIAEAVSSVPRFAANPPRTSRMSEGGVEFAIRASVIDDVGSKGWVDAR